MNLRRHGIMVEHNDPQTIQRLLRAGYVEVVEPEVETPEGKKPKDKPAKPAE